MGSDAETACFTVDEILRCLYSVCLSAWNWNKTLPAGISPRSAGALCFLSGLGGAGGRRSAAALVLVRI